MIKFLSIPLTMHYITNLLLISFIPLLNLNNETKLMIGAFVTIVMVWMLLSHLISIIGITLLYTDGKVRQIPYGVKWINLLIISLTIIIGLLFLDKPSFLQILAICSLANIIHVHTYAIRSCHI